MSEMAAYCSRVKRVGEPVPTARIPEALGGSVSLIAYDPAVLGDEDRVANRVAGSAMELGHRLTGSGHWRHRTARGAGPGRAHRRHGRQGPYRDSHA
jgi:hypothetical protein